jgi:hypothetical protein
MASPLKRRVRFVAGAVGLIVAAAIWFLGDPLGGPTLRRRLRGGFLDKALVNQAPKWISKSPWVLQLLSSGFVARKQALSEVKASADRMALIPDLLCILQDPSEPFEIRFAAVEALEAIPTGRPQLERAMDSLAESPGSFRHFAVSWRLNRFHGNLSELNDLVRDVQHRRDSEPLRTEDLERLTGFEDVKIRFEPVRLPQPMALDPPRSESPVRPPPAPLP